MLDDLLADLARVTAAPQAPGFVDRFEEVVERIAHVDEPESISGLLRFVDARLPDELCFAIVHTAERFPDETYVPHLLATLPELYGRAPEWAGILVRRVLNAPGSRAVLTNRRPDLPRDQARTLHEVMRALSTDHPNG